MPNKSHVREAQAENEISERERAGEMGETLSRSTTGILVRQFDQRCNPVDVEAQIARIAALREGAFEICPDDYKVNCWLKRPNEALGGLPPAEFATSDERLAKALVELEAEMIRNSSGLPFLKERPRN